MRLLALSLLALGLILILLGGLLWLAWRFNLPLGRLPGDLHWQGKHWSIRFPIVTCLLLSIMLTILLKLLFRR